MHDAAGVRSGKGVRDLHGVLDDAPDRKRAARQHLPERRAAQWLGYDVGRLRVGADIVDRQDVRMSQQRGRPRLLVKFRQPRRVSAELGLEDPHRHVAALFVVPHAIQLTHARDVENGENFVGTEACSGRKRHVAPHDTR
jgi:hypothetical protein